MPMIKIPPDRLPRETLTAIIEEFIAREATDYGVTEVAFSVKVEQVRKQVLRGEVLICFDPRTESTNLITRHAFNKIKDEHPL